MKKSLFWTAVAIAFGTAGAAYAHGGNVAEHGGVILLVADTSVELVNAPVGVQVFVEEEGEETPSATMTGKLVITDGGAAREVALEPAAGNMWEAKGVTIAKGAKVNVVMIDTTSHAKTNANFTIE